MHDPGPSQSHKQSVVTAGAFLLFFVSNSVSVMTFIGFFHQKKMNKLSPQPLMSAHSWVERKYSVKKPQPAGMLYQELDLPRLKEFYKDLCCAGLI